MRIGFIGNANNYPFMLARALMRLGHDVVFIVTHDKSVPLDRPENKYDDVLPYPAWIIDLSHLELWNYAVSSPQKSRVVDILQSCDVVIFNQYYICLAPEIMKPCIILLTGTDLLTCSRLEHVDEMASVSCCYEPFTKDFSFARKFYQARVDAQRFGIKNALFVNFYPKGSSSEVDNLLSEIGVADEHRSSFLMTDTFKIPYCEPSQNDRLRVFCATRLTWDRTKPPSYTVLDYKGSDVMIKGIGLFIESGGDAEVHLIRKGAHITETMELADKVGISDHLIWHDEMTQKEVYEQYRLCDIVIEQLDKNLKGLLGMSGLDAMATGRPVIAYDHSDSPFTKAFPGASPICHAANPQEVCAQLITLSDREARKKAGKYARQCVEEKFSSDSAAHYIDSFLRIKRNALRIDKTKYYYFAHSQYNRLTGRFLSEDQTLYPAGLHADFLEYFSRILQTNPDLISSHESLSGYIFPVEIKKEISDVLNEIASGHPGNALAKVQHLIQQYPYNTDLYNFAAEIYLSEKDYKHAKETLFKALTLSHDNIHALNYLALVYIEAKMYIEALDVLSRVLKSEPKNKTAKTNMNYLRQALTDNINPDLSKAVACDCKENKNA